MGDAPVDLSFGKPLGHISGAAVEAIAREVVEEWKRIEPEEVQHWLKARKAHAELLYRDGWTKGKMLGQHTTSIPMYVALMMGRRLGDPNWIVHDYKALEALRAVLPQCAVNSGKSMKLDADQ